jgi:hypothetical protein
MMNNLQLHFQIYVLRTIINVLIKWVIRDIYYSFVTCTKCYSNLQKHAFFTCSFFPLLLSKSSRTRQPPPLRVPLIQLLPFVTSEKHWLKFCMQHQSWNVIKIFYWMWTYVFDIIIRGNYLRGTMYLS